MWLYININYRNIRIIHQILWWVFFYKSYFMNYHINYKILIILRILFITSSSIHVDEWCGNCYLSRWMLDASTISWIQSTLIWMKSCKTNGSKENHHKCGTVKRLFHDNQFRLSLLGIQIQQRTSGVTYICL